MSEIDKTDQYDWNQCIECCREWLEMYEGEMMMEACCQLVGMMGVVRICWRLGES